MKKIIIPFLFFSLFIFSNCSDTKEKRVEIEQNRLELRNYAINFAAGLKAVLQKKLKEGGPLKGVKVCSDTAMALTNLFSESMEIEMRRVSFNYRNPLNEPDEFEKKVLADFFAKNESKALNNDSEYLEISAYKGERVLRYMKPIFVEAVCLNCHGSQNEISAEVNEVLNEKYPQDKAVGYQIGDLRGAISIIKSLE